MWRFETVPPEVYNGITPERWDLIVICLCAGLFGLGMLIARSL